MIRRSVRPSPRIPGIGTSSPSLFIPFAPFHFPGFRRRFPPPWISVYLFRHGTDSGSRSGSSPRTFAHFAAVFRSSTRSVLSQVNSGSSRPK